ncbi:MAG: hypothetical protein M3Y59_05425 [Myxococcota bacterium]|nr:hypothetical protein [Myxococcota bacterium]
MRLLALSVLLLSLPVGATSPVELVRLDGQHVPLASLQRPVTVMLLWTSMCADPAPQLRVFDALARHYAHDSRVGMFTVSVDNPKTPEDLAVIEEIVAPLKLSVPVTADQRFRLLGLVEGKDFDAAPPTELRVPMVVVMRDGQTLHREGLSSAAQPAEIIAHYSKLVDAQLAKLPAQKTAKKKKAPPAAKR